MRYPSMLRLALLGVALCTSPVHAAPDEKSAADMGEIARTVARMLESAHYNRQRLNDEITPGVTQARQALDRYLETLDYNRLFFTQADIDEFVRLHGEGIQDDIMLGNLEPAYKIYDRFLQRVAERVGKIKVALEQDLDFDSNRVAQINRDKLPWPADEAEADKIWSTRIEAEVLQATLAEKALEEAAAKKKKSGDAAPDNAASALPKRTPKEQVLRRYERLLKSLREETREDHANTFLTALTQSYDPHSDYMSQRALDNFNIIMGLSLVGIGAELRNEDGYAKIQRLVPGGPAERGGKLAVNDRIVAVAQGSGEFEDVVDMKLDRVVERIRGKKGTTVRLQVIPAASSDPSKLEVVTIVRDEVKLKDEEAKAQVIEAADPDGKQSKIGWITLPSFYANMDRRGAPKSTTQDVAALLKRLKREGIEGLVIDLRRDSGGSLDEAVRLTGLFIPKGPVVQAKDTNGNINALNDPDPSVLWDGPLIVLTNRLSASASEIFAAALQDYGRAVIVGDEQTFGKGTVQTLLEVDRFMPLFASSGKSGAVKLTIQKFYRIKGGSTQLRGVNSDIVLPSLTDQADVGEGALKNPLDYDEVPARSFTAIGSVGSLIPRLRAASAARLAVDPEFSYIQEDRERLRKRLDENAVSLNKQIRIEEIEQDKARREARLAERKARDRHEFAAVEVTLDSVNARELQKVSLDKPPKRTGLEEFEDGDDPSAPAEEEIFVDPVRDETLLIMQDYIRLKGQPPVTASAQSADAPTP
ncbi:MAG: carboxy terminal-processing peptidase [Chthoniobacterales bacterium]|nr:carboxy terminal-processing peptidase [Chthoniobacterales bacterium]